MIKVDQDKCVNCHQCISVCTVKFCNNGSKDHVEVNSDLCIGCGECLEACEHNARQYIDDWEEGQKALKQNNDMIGIVAPSIAANFPEHYKNINGWLKDYWNAEAIFDVSFGAELTVKSYLEYIQEKDPECVIAQPCPALVNYIKIYAPELLSYLAPADSPMLHTIKMVEEFYPEYRDHKIIMISPCIAKKQEFESTGYGGKVYNITITTVKNYFDESNDDLTKYPEIDFEGPRAERASGFSTPGGLLKTVKREVPDIESTARKIEGPEEIYDYFDNLTTSVDSKVAPLLIDCLNCSLGCNGGTGVDTENMTRDQLDTNVRKRVEELKAEYQKEQDSRNFITQLFDSEDPIETQLLNHWDRNLYDRDYNNQSHRRLKEPDENELNDVFHKMKKYEKEDKEVNCANCGYNSCKKMAKAIFLGLNKPENCHYYVEKNMEEAKARIEERKEKSQERAQHVSELVEDISKKLQELNSSNKTVASRAQNTVKKASNSLQGLQTLVDKSLEVTDEVDNLKNIVEEISDIANRTNLLAMNATIEADRAGNAGDAFNVVADEIKNLSINSKSEAEDIGAFVEDFNVQVEEVMHSIQKKVSQIENALEENSETSKEIVEFTNEIDETIQTITNEVKEINQSKG